MNAIDLGRNVIQAEIEALSLMQEKLNGSFDSAIASILQSSGRVIVLGMGKSGIIGKKIAATLASTGTPAYCIHPGEAFHGDLGMIKPEDVVLMISNSGETEELVRLLPFLVEQGNRVIAMTGKLNSTLARHAPAVLDVSVEMEACNNNLAPTSSTTAALVMGDAIAVSLSTIKGFKPEDFARFHPGGSLGRRLLTRVSEVMHRGPLPWVKPQAGFKEVVHAISTGRLGMALVGEPEQLIGVVSDGDLRRAFENYPVPTHLLASDLMAPQPLVVSEEERFAIAEEKMQAARVNALIVVDSSKSVCGVLQIFDIGADGPVAVQVMTPAAVAAPPADAKEKTAESASVVAGEQPERSDQPSVVAPLTLEQTLAGEALPAQRTTH